MHIVAIIAVAIVALVHIGFLLLEMVFWDTPRGMRTFGTTPEFAKQSKVLAANQGLYNGFLAAGLLWSLYPIGAPDAGEPIASFFLLCAAVAGIYGAITVSHRIFFVQALPALVALGLVWLLY